MSKILIAGTASHCGKTTVSLALMRSLIRRGQSVAPFKVGPDYIDPMFHKFVCNRPSHNLDAHLMDQDGIDYLIQVGSAGADIAVIEGVMGYYDGMGSDFHCSSYDMAKRTNAPALLVIDASGSATSAAAVALGFMRIVEDSRIAGAIINRVASERHYELVKDALQKHANLRCVGYMKKDAGLNLESRHLGLIPANELSGLREKIDRAADNLHIDWEMFDAISGVDVALPPAMHPSAPSLHGKKIAVAMDAAFSFYYEANLMLLRDAGAELRYFSPIADAQLPENIDGLYLGGGFPEVFKDALSANVSMRDSIRSTLENGLCCYAECGGMMYLTQSIDGNDMVGFFDGHCHMTDRLQRFGYVTVDDGERQFPAHEFHRSTCESSGFGAFSIAKAADPDQTWRSGLRKLNVVADYAHRHFLAQPDMIDTLWGEKA